MGEMTPQFREQMRRMMGLRFAPVDLTTHWEALRQMPDAVLGSFTAAAHSSRRFFCCNCCCKHAIRGVNVSVCPRRLCC